MMKEIGKHYPVEEFKIGDWVQLPADRYNSVYGLIEDIWYVKLTNQYMLDVTNMHQYAWFNAGDKLKFIKR